MGGSIHLQDAYQTKEDGTWIYPPTATELEKAGLFTIDEYINRRRAKIKNYAVGTDLYRQCIDLEPLSAMTNRLFWWQQDNDNGS